MQIRIEDRIERLRNRLTETSPIHDTPVGVVHPYWARKPMNIIEVIIEELSKSDDVILDPFMGSGTTLFASIKCNRSCIGSDINPLSSFITEQILRLSEEGIKDTLRDFTSSISAELLPLFEIEHNRYLDRERYDVKGEFEYGNFHLELVETVSKQLCKDKWIKRRVEVNPKELKLPKEKNTYLNNPFDFETTELMPNSRIAISEGTLFSHYFTHLNRVSINLMLEKACSSKYNDRQKSACNFLISSCIPLLRLSDKKASSQWPYWRPKKNLTSRNPVIVLNDRLGKILKAIDWLTDLKFTKSINVFNEPIQELDKKLSDYDVNVIITDPPYSDHVPYLEYSSLWNSILGFKVNGSSFKNEIVNSDAPLRREDTKEYKSRLSISLSQCAKLIKDKGIIVWFYQDQELANWNVLYDTAVQSNLEILDVIPLKKQRRSMKTVTSPGKTLDGDLLILFGKNIIQTKSIKPESSKLVNRGKNYFDDYSNLIKDAMLTGSIKNLTQLKKRIKDIVID